MNILILTGRLTKDAEMSYTKNGTAKAAFSIAVDYRVKVGETWENKANFFNVNLWGKQAEGLTKHLTKGREVRIEGELVNANYEKDGQKVYKDEIRVKNFELGSAAKPGAKEDSHKSQESQTFAAEAFQDDIPF